jgi:N-succinyldiaminopimelate aminotransferase
MNPLLERLHPYPFEKLAQLFRGAQPPAGLPHIALSIGEPKHASPAFVTETLAASLGKLSVYPTTKGLPELRTAIAAWAGRRFGLERCALDPEQHVLPVNGTREALFAFAQVVIDPSRDGLVVSPNPFYQIYEGAALLSGAQLHFLACTQNNGFLPDIDAVPAEVWKRCQLLYLCSPGNPTGAIIPAETLCRLIALADEHDFVIASDECYSELYDDESAPPPGLLSACESLGRADFSRCVVFHSLSKRSNVPGLRSGFVAGDASLMARFLLYRTYHGCAMPVQHQLASIAAWNDEAHVVHNRELYRRKFDAVLEILSPVLDVTRPPAGFYLWPSTPIADTDFARGLFASQHVTVLPGQYLAREWEGLNPGAGRVRMALVASHAECVEAAQRIKAFVQTL